MKKLLLFTMMLAVASVFTACEDTDAKLAEKLKGSWKGTTLINDEEYPMAYQFFESTDGKTGKFVEMTSDKYLEEIDGEEYVLPYVVYVGGQYKIDEGWLSLTYSPETTVIEIYEDALNNFAEAYLAYDRAKEEPSMGDATVEEVAELYKEYIFDEDNDNWTEMYEKLNANKADGFSNLSINEGKMSYKTGDAGRLEFESTDEIFKQYPFDE